MKSRQFLLLAVAAAFIGVFAFLWLSPEQMLKRAIEREGSAICGAPVRVEHVTWSSDTHTFVVSGVTIGNPTGFPAGDLLVAPVVEIAADPATFGKDPVHVERLTLSAPRLQLASNPTGSNFDAVDAHIRAFAAQPGARRYTVDLLTIRDAKANIGSGSDADLLGVRSDDLGSKSGGVTAVELARTISDEVGQRLKLVVGIENLKSGLKNLLGQ